MNSKINFVALPVLAILMCVSQALAQSPQVLSTSPSTHELGVSTNITISATFDSDMDAASIDETSFIAVGDLMGRYTGTIGYDPPSRTATFDPDADFKPGEIVTVTLTTGVTSAGYEPIIGYSFSFIVGIAGGFADLPHRTAFAGSQYGWTLLPGDFDEDADIDLALGLGDIFHDTYLLLNDGMGDFNSVERNLTGDWNLDIAAADMDYDGDIDLLSPYGHYEKSRLINAGVSLNDGSGVFGYGPTMYFGSASARAPLTSDLDCDGKMDILCITAEKIALGYYISGDFFDIIPPEGYDIDTYQIRVGDVDNDGLPDIVYKPETSNNLYVVFNEGNRVFGMVPVEIANEDVVNHFWMGEFNGDGFLDIAIASADKDRIRIYSNNGNGTFTSSGDYDLLYEPTSLAIGDLDGDVDLDIVAIADDGSHFEINILWNDGTGQFPTSDAYPLTNDDAYSPVISDLNNDGNPDIAVISRERSKVSIYWNLEAFYVCGDANGDGMANVGDAVYLVTYIFQFGPPPEPIEAGDANCDGSVDVGDAVYLVNYVFMKGPAPCCY